MENLAKCITNYYCRKNIIDEKKKDIYCYGFKLIIADIINYSIIMVLGIILNRIVDSLMFLVTLCGVRQFSGGFHAKTFLICRLSFILTYIIVMCLSQLMSRVSVDGIIGLNIISIIFIACYAPVENPNKPMTEVQKENNKLKSVIASVFM